MADPEMIMQDDPEEQLIPPGAFAFGLELRIDIPVPVNPGPRRNDRMEVLKWHLENERWNEAMEYLKGELDVWGTCVPGYLEDNMVGIPISEEWAYDAEKWLVKEKGYGHNEGKTSRTYPGAYSIPSWGSVRFLKERLQKKGKVDYKAGEENERYKKGFIRVWDRYLKDDEDESTRELRDGVEAELTSVSSLQDLEENHPCLYTIWKKTDLVLRFVMERNLDDPLKDGRDWLPLHAMAMLGFPTFLLWFALKLYPEQIRMRDEYRKLPLHYVVTQQPSKEHGLDRMNFTGDIRVAKKFPITLLLRDFPDGAGYADGDGRLPLSLALETKPTWRKWVIEPLVKSAPDALITRDPKTGMFPFSQAVMEKQPLDVVYGILRENPAVISYFTPQDANVMEQLCSSMARLSRSFGSMFVSK